jgi:hypothetical protein
MSSDDFYLAEISCSKPKLAIGSTKGGQAGAGEV